MLVQKRAAKPDRKEMPRTVVSLLDRERATRYRRRYQMTSRTPESRRAHWAKLARERRTKLAAERIEALAALTCTVCGKPLNATRKSRAYCSPRCRQWAHRHPEALTSPATPP